MKKLLSVLLTLTLLTTPINVMADTNETDWKTAITSESFTESLFEEYEESKILYTSTYLNMRTFPNIDSDVRTVLKTNAEVTAVAEYQGWTKIIIKNSFGENEYYYLWNKYLSEEKVVIKTPSKKSSNNNSVTYSGTGEYLGNFKLTAYCNCSSCCGKWAGGATASGVMPSAGRTVAMGGIAFGTKLLINGHVYTVEDRGTPYGHVDIYFNSHGEALQFGLRYADVYRVG